MKIVKLTMLAAIAAIAAMAFIGVSSASALLHPVIQLCKAQQLLLCETKNLIKHPLKGRLLLLPGKGTFKALFTATCTGGMGNSNEFEFGTTEIKQELAELTFTGCEGGCKAVEVKKGPELLIHEEEVTSQWYLLEHIIIFIFKSCTGGITCTFQGNLKGKIQTDAEGSFFNAATDKPTFSFTEGSKIFCGETLTWNEGITRLDWRLDDGVKQADGTLGTIHKPVYLTLLEKLTVAS